MNYSILATRIEIKNYRMHLNVPAMQEFVIVQPSYPGIRVWAIAVPAPFWDYHWAPTRTLQPRQERTLFLVRLGPNVTEMSPTIIESI
jgi:hypothetical protein